MSSQSAHPNGSPGRTIRSYRLVSLGTLYPGVMAMSTSFQLYVGLHDKHLLVVLVDSVHNRPNTQLLPTSFIPSIFLPLPALAGINSESVSVYTSRRSTRQIARSCLMGYRFPRSI